MSRRGTDGSNPSPSSGESNANPDADDFLAGSQRCGLKLAANAHLGRLDEARAELSRQLSIDPKLTIAGYRKYAHTISASPEVLELLVSGLRLAGLPEK